jgi:hypothetical protein
LIIGGESVDPVGMQTLFRGKGEPSLICLRQNRSKGFV